MPTIDVAATSPVQGAERLDMLDAVRGASVLGILLANIVPLSGHAFAPPGAHLGLPLASLHDPLMFLMFVFVEAKFYSLFSFLFGVGFAVFVSRAAARGADAARLFRRRMVGLLAIGVIHSVFIWMGDILATYAVMGFALLPFLRKDDRRLLQWATAMLLLPILLYGATLAAVAIATADGLRLSAGNEAGALPPVLAGAVASFANGSYADVVQGNVIFTAANAVRRLILMFFPRIFGMFLLGFYVGRRDLFAELDRHVPLLRRVLLWGSLVGLPLSLLGAFVEGNSMGAPNVLGFVETTAKAVGAPALSLAYAAGLGLLLPRARRIRHAFAAAGQMALTNYLLHSVAGVVIFYGIGFGLFGRVPLAIVTAGAVVFFVVQMLASRAWLAHAAFGPVEWLWRMFTYGRRVPLFGRAR